MWDGSCSGVVIIIIVVEGTPTGMILPTKWCDGGVGIVDDTPAVITIPSDGSGCRDTPTDGGGCSDGRADGTSTGTVIPTNGCPDVRCRWDWGISDVDGIPTGADIPVGGGDRLVDVRCRRNGGSSSTRYRRPSRSRACLRWERWLPLRRTPSASTTTWHLA
jgi:hypothetical protein